jgi:hypothetical protein
MYLLDNETSTLVLVSSSAGLLIDLWKLSRAVNVKVASMMLQVLRGQGALCLC